MSATQICPTAKEVLDRLEIDLDTPLTTGQIVIVIQEVVSSMLSKYATLEITAEAPNRFGDSDKVRVYPREANGARPILSGDICKDCGSAQMVRTGTCLTCQACGSSSGGCS